MFYTQQELIVDPKRQQDPILFGGLGSSQSAGGGGQAPSAAAVDSPLEASTSGIGTGTGAGAGAGAAVDPLALPTEGSGGVVSRAGAGGHVPEPGHGRDQTPGA